MFFLLVFGTVPTEWGYFSISVWNCSDRVRVFVLLVFGTVPTEWGYFFLLVFGTVPTEWGYFFY